MSGYARHDAADHALDTLSNALWGELVQRAALLVVRVRVRDGAPVDAGWVQDVAAGVVGAFAEGEPVIEVYRGVEGRDLVESILRGLAPRLIERAREG